VGLPLGSAVVTSSARLGGVTEGNNSVGGKTAEPRRYVDNPMNRRLERVGMIVGSQPVTKKTAQPSTTSASRQNDIFRPLVKIDPEVHLILFVFLVPVCSNFILIFIICIG